MQAPVTTPAAKAAKGARANTAGKNKAVRPGSASCMRVLVPESDEDDSDFEAEPSASRGSTARGSGHLGVRGTQQKPAGVEVIDVDGED